MAVHCLLMMGRNGIRDVSMAIYPPIGPSQVHVDEQVVGDGVKAFPWYDMKSIRPLGTEEQLHEDSWRRRIITNCIFLGPLPARQKKKPEFVNGV
jgi:hypothetical protein